MRVAITLQSGETVLLAVGALLIGMAGWSSLRYHLFQSFTSAPAGTHATRLADTLLAPAFRTTTGQPLRAAGRIEIPRLRLSVQVVDGDEEEGLAVAAVHLAGTPRIGDLGNAVVAGHRDTAFWPLRDVKQGDLIRVRRADGRSAYKVDSIRVVDPDDVSVLQSSPEAALTLLTCYPFRYVGSAPKRFVVHARLLRQ